MASIRERKTSIGKRSWQVVYRGPDSKQRTKQFERKTDAQRYANTIEADLARHDWVDPQRGRQPFGEWAEKWMETNAGLKPKTREGYESILRNHLMPVFQDRALGSVDHVEVLAFIANLTKNGKAPGTVGNILDVLRLVFKLAVRSGVIKVNPTDDVRAPRAAKSEMIFLTGAQVIAVAEEIQDPPALQRGASHRDGGYPDYNLLVRFTAFTGLRAGEIGALRVSRINLKRARVEVSESADEAYGKFNIGPTKNYRRRSVGFPTLLVEQMADYLSGKKQNDLVFEGPEGGPIRHSNWYPRHFKPAVVRARVPTETRFHDLRHTYAAFLIAEGAHPRAMMERMGHSSIKVTLDTYGHLFPSIDAKLDTALSDLYRRATALEVEEVQTLSPGETDSAA